MEQNDSGFRAEAYDIANDFDMNGDYQLAEYIMALLSNTNVFVPQNDNQTFNFFEKVSLDSDPLPLPKEIEDDVIGVINAANRNLGVNKFLFQGAPGTGKTETAKQIARILGRDLYSVSFTTIIDSKLGQTQKNIVSLFSEINSLIHPERVIVLFDEIDAIALDRTNQQDLREMGRTTSTLLKELDKLNNEIILIATTNLYEQFDKAIIRRFDTVLNFDRYSKDDLMDIAEILLKYYLNKSKDFGSNIKLFRKIMNNADTLPYPGDIKNMLKTSIAFSDPSNEFDYLRRIYKSFVSESIDIGLLQKQGFTLREIEVLTGVSKSQLGRTLKG